MSTIKFAPGAKALIGSSLLMVGMVLGIKYGSPDPCDRPVGFTLYEQEIATELIKTKSADYPKIVQVLGNGCRMRNSQGLLVIVWRSKMNNSKIRLFLGKDDKTILKSDIPK